uniref:Uncharacterized protein n=1 Tax=Rhizophora mucronata TaxID=61149 RepID=A0A2P2NHR6_RHIMU
MESSVPFSFIRPFHNMISETQPMSRSC